MCCSTLLNFVNEFKNQNVGRMRMKLKTKYEDVGVVSISFHIQLRSNAHSNSYIHYLSIRIAEIVSTKTD